MTGGLRPSFRTSTGCRDYREDLGVDQTSYYRSLEEWERRLWQTSPYSILSSRQYVFVHHSGAVLFWAREKLRANSERRRVNFLVTMKGPRRVHYRRQFAYGKDEGTIPPTVSEADYLRSRWFMSFFRVMSNSGKTITSFSDDIGTTSKAPDLALEEDIKGTLASRPVAKDETFHREIVVGLLDYAQRAESALPSSDHAQIPVAVAMRDLRVTVVVDKSLYHDKMNAPPLHLTLRNPEEAGFATTELLDETDIAYGPVTDRQRLLRLHRAFERRLAKLGQIGQCSHGNTILRPSDEASALDLAFPKEILAYEISWPWARGPVVLCVNWRMPHRD